jgi:Fe(3+) dicitrate transport protein
MTFGSGSSIFAGVHRGFGPPRVKDAISSGGESEQLDAELSWNYEAGARFASTKGLNAEFSIFFMDFSNQIIPVSESSGGLVEPGASGLTNGGETTHKGAELSISGNLGEINSSKLGLNFSVSATISDATFSNDRFVTSGGGTVNIRGNTLPYAPRLMLSSTVEWIEEGKFSLGLTGTYVGSQFGDVLNTIQGSVNGRSGEIPSWQTIDANMSVPLKLADGLRFNSSIKNIFDSRHIVSRRPQGIRAGLPRFITVGFELSL